MRIRRPTLVTVGLAFAVGAITAAAWAAFTKRNLERTFATGADGLRQELQSRGGTLRQEIAQLAADSAVQAVRDELEDFGITAGMLADLQTAVAAADAARSGARRAGMSVEQYLRRLAA